MKKLFFVWLVFALLPITLSAQQMGWKSAEENLSPSMPKKHNMLVVSLLESLNAKATRQARALEEKDLAQKEEEKAAAALKALITAYPEHEALLSKVFQGHANLIRFAAEQENEKKLAEELNIQMEYLYVDVVSLERMNADVAAQVKQILHHEYWIYSQKESLNWDEMKRWVYQTFADSKGNKKAAPSWYAAL